MKIALASLVGLLLLVGLGLALLDSILATAMTASVGYVTQQETTLESVELGLFSGEFRLHGLRIANPPGFSATPLLTVLSFETKLHPRSLLLDSIEVQTLELDGLQLALEWRGSQSNVSALLARLEELQASASAPPAPEPSQPNAAGAGGPELHIARIRIAGVKTTLRISGVPLADGVYELSLPEVVLEDFGSDMDHATAAEWTAHVLRSLLERALVAGQEVFPEAWQTWFSSGLQADKLLKGNWKQTRDELEHKGKDLLKEAKEDPAGFLRAHKQEVKDLRKLLRGGK